MTAATVRVAGADDAALLAELGARTFRESFGAQNNPADLEAHLASAWAPHLQASELADDACTYLIAEVDGRTAGFALVHEGEAPSCVVESPAIELARFYVDRPFQGAGVAQVLMLAAKREAIRRNARVIWLGAWERNPRAIRFYEKSGFSDVGSKIFVVGSDPQTDRVMICSLVGTEAG